jgi:hydroxymethylbilane synthase
VELGEADATLLAAAGLDRLGCGSVGTVMTDMLPAPSQGAIGVEVCAHNNKVRSLVEAIDHRPTHVAVAAERIFLEGLGGDCRSPVAALAQCEGDEIRFRAEILTNDGLELEWIDTRFPASDLKAPCDLARQMLERAPPALRALFRGPPSS